MYKTTIRNVLVLKLLSLMMLNAYSQSDPQYSHYMYNQLAYNPGYAGSSDDIVLNMLGRQQWVGFPGFPNELDFNISAPFKLFGRSHGAGLAVHQDNLGFNATTTLNLSYAFKINVGGGSLGIGINGGLIQWKVDASSGDNGGEGGGWVPPSESLGQQYYTQLNPTQDDISFDASAGLFYRTDDIFLGLSATHLLGPTSGFDILPEGDGNLIDDFEYYIKPHYYVNAGYIFQLNNPAFELFPSFLITSDGQTSKLDVNSTLVYNKRVWGGLSYRVGAAITGMAGVELIENLRIGFAYDFGTNDILDHAPAIYEIFATYSFSLNVEKIPQRYKSIRYL